MTVRVLGGGGDCEGVGGGGVTVRVLGGGGGWRKREN